MRRIAPLLLFAVVISNALTLEQVKADLKKSPLASDSVEMNIKTTISTTLTQPQSITIYMVCKGPSKIYSEIKMPLMSQRSVVNGNRMKVVDLNTGKSQVLPYNGEVLDAMQYTNFNPLDSGSWQTPKRFEGNIYTIKGTSGTLYYDAKKKRIEKVFAENDGKPVETLFTYNADNSLKSMKVVVSADGVEAVVLTEVLRLRNSTNFPDKLFEF
ncbi:hypothetical protein [Fibrobacter intestinalis]|uniref:Outer membrane lipoprotein-sorting protein n=1 Tax=Fibrobacter intestinalis TaxID=28122 RepID=A0A1T4M7M5_9BACT|nr:MULTISPECIES: hypothetical protein [Fibrobacter]PBC73592.1 hypothetical protein BGW94_1208 [Fibrobacter sp. NR9]SJZ63009.1 hypothetical protein SAMN02745108_01158 [Fibrobacter intestinalis]